MKLVVFRSLSGRKTYINAELVAMVQKGDQAKTSKLSFTGTEESVSVAEPLKEVVAKLQNLESQVDKDEPSGPAAPHPERIGNAEGSVAGGEPGLGQPVREQASKRESESPP